VSIYATLWTLQFPRHGDVLADQGEWVEVIAQAVPSHVGTPTPGYGYEGGDPYADFLPPAGPCGEGTLEWRAVVFVTRGSAKGTSRSGQEYAQPLFVATGREYEEASFAELHGRICDALRGDRPRAALRVLFPDGTSTLVFDDGSVRAPSRDP
jgi:hypothetical protein